MEETRLPKHRKLKQEILSWLHAGQLLPDERLPSEHEMAELFQVSRHTVRQTLGQLVHEGWLYRIQGKGTFVSQPAEPVGTDSLRTVGVITTYISDYIFPLIIRGAEAILRKSGYRLLLASTDNDKRKECEALDSMLSAPLDGLIIEPTKSASDNVNLDRFLALEQRGMPYLMINEVYTELDCPYVKINDEQGAYAAVAHLIELGHRRIAGCFKTDDLQGQRRLKGYLRAHREHRVAVNPAHIIRYTTEEKLSKPQREIAELLAGTEPISAVFGYNDELAATLLEVIRKCGKRVPEDVAVVGFDDSSWAPALDLTSVAHPKTQLGVAAAEMLIAMIEGKPDYRVKSLDYEPHLVVRGSSGSPLQ